MNFTALGDLVAGDVTRQTATLEKANKLKERTKEKTDRLGLSSEDGTDYKFAGTPKQDRLLGLQDGDTAITANIPKGRDWDPDKPYMDSTELNHGSRTALEAVQSDKWKHPQLAHAAALLGKPVEDITNQDLIDVGNMQQVQKLADLVRKKGEPRWQAPLIRGAEQLNLTGKNYKDEYGHKLDPIPLDVPILSYDSGKVGTFGRHLAQYGDITGNNVSAMQARDPLLNSNYNTTTSTKKDVPSIAELKKSIEKAKRENETWYNDGTLNPINWVKAIGTGLAESQLDTADTVLDVGTGAYNRLVNTKDKDYIDIMGSSTSRRKFIENDLGIKPSDASSIHRADIRKYAGEFVKDFDITKLSTYGNLHWDKAASAIGAAVQDPETSFYSLSYVGGLAAGLLEKGAAKVFSSIFGTAAKAGRTAKQLDAIKLAEDSGNMTREAADVAKGNVIANSGVKNKEALATYINEVDTLNAAAKAGELSKAQLATSIAKVKNALVSTKVTKYEESLSKLSAMSALNVDKTTRAIEAATTQAEKDALTKSMKLKQAKINKAAQNRFMQLSTADKAKIIAKRMFPSAKYGAVIQNQSSEQYLKDTGTHQDVNQLIIGTAINGVLGMFDMKLTKDVIKGLSTPASVAKWVKNTVKDKDTAAKIAAGITEAVARVGTGAVKEIPQELTQSWGEAFTSTWRGLDDNNEGLSTSDAATSKTAMQRAAIGALSSPAMVAHGHSATMFAKGVKPTTKGIFNKLDQIAGAHPTDSDFNEYRDSAVNANIAAIQNEALANPTVENIHKAAANIEKEASKVDGTAITKTVAYQALLHDLNMNAKTDEEKAKAKEITAEIHNDDSNDYNAFSSKETLINMARQHLQDVIAKEQVDSQEDILARAEGKEVVKQRSQEDKNEIQQAIEALKGLTEEDNSHLKGSDKYTGKEEATDLIQAMKDYINGKDVNIVADEVKNSGIRKFDSEGNEVTPNKHGILEWEKQINAVLDSDNKEELLSPNKKGSKAISLYGLNNFMDSRLNKLTKPKFKDSKLLSAMIDENEVARTSLVNMLKKVTGTELSEETSKAYGDKLTNMINTIDKAQTEAKAQLDAIDQVEALHPKAKGLSFKNGAIVQYRGTNDMGMPIEVPVFTVNDGKVTPTNNKILEKGKPLHNSSDYSEPEDGTDIYLGDGTLLDGSNINEATNNTNTELTELHKQKDELNKRLTNINENTPIGEKIDYHKDLLAHTIKAYEYNKKTNQTKDFTDKVADAIVKAADELNKAINTKESTSTTNTSNTDTSKPELVNLNEQKMMLDQRLANMNDNTTTDEKIKYQKDVLDHAIQAYQYNKQTSQSAKIQNASTDAVITAANTLNKVIDKSNDTSNNTDTSITPNNDEIELKQLKEQKKDLDNRLANITENTPLEDKIQYYNDALSHKIKAYEYNQKTNQSKDIINTANDNILKAAYDLNKVTSSANNVVDKNIIQLDEELKNKKDALASAISLNDKNKETGQNENTILESTNKLIQAAYELNKAIDSANNNSINTTSSNSSTNNSESDIDLVNPSRTLDELKDDFKYVRLNIEDQAENISKDFKDLLDSVHSDIALKPAIVAYKKQIQAKFKSEQNILDKALEKLEKQLAKETAKRDNGRDRLIKKSKYSDNKVAGKIIRRILSAVTSSIKKLRKLVQEAASKLRLKTNTNKKIIKKLDKMIEDITDIEDKAFTQIQDVKASDTVIGHVTEANDSVYNKPVVRIGVHTVEAKGKNIVTAMKEARAKALELQKIELGNGLADTLAKHLVGNYPLSAVGKLFRRSKDSVFSTESPNIFNEQIDTILDVLPMSFKDFFASSKKGKDELNKDLGIMKSWTNKLQLPTNIGYDKPKIDHTGLVGGEYKNAVMTLFTNKDGMIDMPEQMKTLTKFYVAKMLSDINGLAHIIAFKDETELAKMGITGEDEQEIAHTRAMNGEVPISSVRADIGKAMYNALGIKVAKSTPELTEESVISGLALLVQKVAEEVGLITTENVKINGSELKYAKVNEGKINSILKDSTVAELFTSINKLQYMNEANTRKPVSKKAYPDRDDRKVMHSNYPVGGDADKFINSQEKIGYKLNKKLDKWISMDDADVLKAFGYLDLEDEKVTSGMHVSEQQKQMALNDKISREWETLKMYHTALGTDTTFYLPWGQTVSGRYTLLTDLNYQESKMHREFVKASDSKSEVDWQNKDQMNIFMAAVSQGLDMDPDKVSNKTMISNFKSMFDITKKGVKILEDGAIKDAFNTIKNGEYNADIIARVFHDAEGYHGISAIEALVDLDRAIKNGTKADISVKFEIDAITSGMILTLLQLGTKDAMRLAEKGGIYSKARANDLEIYVKHWLGKDVPFDAGALIEAGKAHAAAIENTEDGKATKEQTAKLVDQETSLLSDVVFKDLYSTIGIAMVEEVKAKKAELISTVEKGGSKSSQARRQLALLEAIGPLTLKNVRSIAKSPVMVYIYGASIGSIKKKLAYSLGIATLVKAIKNGDNPEFIRPYITNDTKYVDILSKPKDVSNMDEAERWMWVDVNSIIKEMQKDTDATFGKGIETAFKNTFSEVDKMRDMTKSVELLTFEVYRARLNNRIDELGLDRAKLSKDRLLEINNELVREGYGHDILTYDKNGNVTNAQPLTKKEKVTGSSSTGMNTKKNKYTWTKNGSSTATIKEETDIANTGASSTISIHNIDGDLMRRVLSSKKYVGENVYDAIILDMQAEILQSTGDAYNNATVQQGFNRSILVDNFHKLDNMLKNLSPKEYENLVDALKREPNEPNESYRNDMQRLHLSMNKMLERLNEYKGYNKERLDNSNKDVVANHSHIAGIVPLHTKTGQAKKLGDTTRVETLMTKIRDEDRKDGYDYILDLNSKEANSNPYNLLVYSKKDKGWVYNKSAVAKLVSSDKVLIRGNKVPTEDTGKGSTKVKADYEVKQAITALQESGAEVVIEDNDKLSKMFTNNKNNKDDEVAVTIDGTEHKFMLVDRDDERLDGALAKQYIIAKDIKKQEVLEYIQGRNDASKTSIQKAVVTEYMKDVLGRDMVKEIKNMSNNDITKFIMYHELGHIHYNDGKGYLADKDQTIAEKLGKGDINNQWLADSAIIREARANEYAFKLLGRTNIAVREKDILPTESNEEDLTRKLKETDLQKEPAKHDNDIIIKDKGIAKADLSKIICK